MCDKLVLLIVLFLSLIIDQSSSYSTTPNYFKTEIKSTQPNLYNNELNYKKDEDLHQHQNHHYHHHHPHHYYADINTTSSNLFSLLRHCIQQPEILKCVKKQTVIVLDNIIQKNESWYFNDYIALTKNPKWNVTTANDDSKTNSTRAADDLDQVLKMKLYALAESRMIQFKLAPDPDTENDVQEGRKKHGGKKKGGYMIGILAVAALILQMKLGKIAMLAGTAFILAKIALLVSLLGSLKKMTGTSSTSDHVVYAADSGHSSGGWQRSIVEPPTTAHETVYKGQIPYQLDTPF